MTDYARVRALVEYSDFSDYGSPRIHAVSDTDTPVSGLIGYLHRAQTGGSTLDLALFDDLTIDYLVVKNTDNSNFVTVAWTSDAASNSNSVKLLAGQFFIVPDVKLAGDITFTADTADLYCEITVVAS